MENKVYVVTSGSYSDYHINAIFSSEEKAKKYIGDFTTTYHISEYQLDDPNEIEKITGHWYASRTSSGEITIDPSCNPPAFIKLFRFELSSSNNSIHMNFPADYNKEKITKILSDTYAQLFIKHDFKTPKPGYYDMNCNFLGEVNWNQIREYEQRL